jgi:[acyl-carrier-protein] S-malonyltransferase
MAEETDGIAVRLRRPMAFLYPPQPLEDCPMPADLLARFPRLADLHSAVLAGLGWDTPIRRETTLRWPREPQSVQQVRGAHVGVAAFSWAMTQMLAEAGLSPDVLFGHSLGLHSALTVSGATPITDTLEVVDRTAQFLAQTHDEAPGAMLAVTGFTPNEISEFCEQMDPPGTVFLAIINSRRQVVVSGQPDSIARLAEQLRAKRAWGLTPIPGRLPLHTPLMAPLADRCAELIEGTHCHVPHIRLLHPTTGGTVGTVSNVEMLWRRHLLGMIDFVSALDEMERSGVATYIEIGVGETLTRLGRWYRRDLPIFGAGNPELLERILHARVE